MPENQYSSGLDYPGHPLVSQQDFERMFLDRDVRRETDEYDATAREEWEERRRAGEDLDARDLAQKKGMVSHMLKGIMGNMRSAQTTHAPTSSAAFKSATLARPTPGRDLAGLVRKGTPWVAEQRCGQPSLTLIQRWRERPQVSQGEWPGAPIPVPFAASELRAAVQNVFAAAPRHGACGASSANHLFVAEKTAEVLALWGPSGGWVRVTPPWRGAGPTVFHLGDKVRRLRNPLAPPGAPLPPPRAVPQDMDHPATTFDHLRRRSVPASIRLASGPSVDQLRAWELQAVGGPGTELAMIQGDTQPAWGTHANLAALATRAVAPDRRASDASDDPFAYEPAPISYDPTDAIPSVRTAFRSDGFQVALTFPIKEKRRCACDSKGYGGACRC